MDRPVTLKDIAQDLNISRTTVHRAINAKDGISDSLRSAILTRASELGYSTNYMASSLKRKAINIAVVLPNRDGNGQFYHKYFWNAIEEFLPEANTLNVNIEFHSFVEDASSQVKLLEEMFDNGKNDIDGLITMPFKCDDNMRQIIRRYSDKNIPVVLLDNDLIDSGRLCCVSPHDQQTGRLAAELISSITPTSGKILVACGSSDNASHVLNLQGFKGFLSEQSKQLELLEIEGYGDFDKCYWQAVNALNKYDDIVAFYSVSARDTLPLTQAVIDCGKSGKLRGIGSDLYPQSAALLKQDALQALIYKNAYDKGYLGFNILFSYVVKNIKPLKQSVTVPISIIMKSNLTFFENRI